MKVRTHSFGLRAYSHPLKDLQRMYSLLARITEGLDPLRKKFEEHVKKAGLAAIAKLQGEAAGSPGGEVVRDGILHRYCGIL